MVSLPNRNAADFEFEYNTIHGVTLKDARRDQDEDKKRREREMRNTVVQTPSFRYLSLSLSAPHTSSGIRSVAVVAVIVGTGPNRLTRSSDSMQHHACRSIR